MEQFYLLKPCKTSAAYDAIPRKNIKVDLAECASKLEMHGYEIVCDANVILVVRDTCKISTSIYPSGKLIIKTDSKDVAKDTADAIYRLIV